MIRRIFAIAAFTLTASCATGAAGATPPGRNPDVISQEELTAPEVESMDALQAVQRLRPRFLTARGMASSASNASAGATHISIDGSALAPLSDLQRLRAGALREIRYLSPTEAAQRFGATAASGSVLLVSSR